MIDAQRLQPHAVNVGHAARGIEYGVCDDDLTAVDGDVQAIRRFGNGNNVGPEPQVNARLGHLAAQKSPHFIIKPAQHQFAPVELGHFGTQAVEDRRKFTGDVAAAHHEQALGEGIKIKHLVGGDDMLAPRHVRDAGRAAGGDQNMLCGVALAVDLNRVRIDQLGEAIDHLDARTVEHVQVNAIEPRKLVLAICLERGPVQLRRSTLPAKAMRLFEAFGKVRGIRVELFGDAAHIDAGAAQHGGAARLGHGHARAPCSGHSRSPHATAAAADHKEVKVEVCHF